MFTSGPIIVSSGNGVPPTVLSDIQTLKTEVSNIDSQLAYQQSEIETLQAQNGSATTIDGGTF